MKINTTFIDISASEKKIFIAMIAFMLLFMFSFALLLSGYNKYEADTNALASKINSLYNQNDNLIIENEVLKSKLNKYLVTEEYLQSIGATQNQAKIIIKATETHNVDPKF